MRYFLAIILITLLIILVIPLALTHHVDNDSNNIEDTSTDASNNNYLFYILLASVISAIFVILALYLQKYPEIFRKIKKILFLGIIIPILILSIFLISQTIYINIISETKGPVHWHADFEIYACDENLDLIDPTGLSNRIGTSVFHEHGDNRIHIEGVVVNYEDVSLDSFFKVIGGHLHKEELIFLTNEGLVEFTNGDLCNNLPGKLQVFVYKTNPDDNTFSQQKLEDFEDYVISPHSIIPPGDCIIIEFSSEEKQKTDKICEPYKIAIQKGEIQEE